MRAKTQRAFPAGGYDKRSTAAWIGAHLADPHRHAVDHGIDRLKVRDVVDAEFLAAVFANQHHAEAVRANPILGHQALRLLGVDHVAIEGAGAVGDDPAKHHVAIREVTSTGFYSAHRFNEPWIIFGRREHQEGAALPKIVTQFCGRGLGRHERSAGRQKDN